MGLKIWVIFSILITGGVADRLHGAGAENTCAMRQKQEFRHCMSAHRYARSWIRFCRSVVQQNLQCPPASVEQELTDVDENAARSCRSAHRYAPSLAHLCQKEIRRAH